MVGIRWTGSAGGLEDLPAQTQQGQAQDQAQTQTQAQAQGPAVAAVDSGRFADADLGPHYSDDERSVAADSWSVKSEYGSTLDGDDLIRQAESLVSVHFRHPSECSFDKEEVEPSVLGLQSHWDSTYAEELANFHEHGDAGEIWFGPDTMDTIAEWVTRICAVLLAGDTIDPVEGLTFKGNLGPSADELQGWNVLDIGTGNGMFLHALFKQGFTDLTGIDYSEAGIDLARAVADHEGLSNIKFLVDDVLDSKLSGQFQLVTDKGTLDAVSLHPDGTTHRALYWKSVARLVAPGGILVITSCNSTKDELLDEVASFGLAEAVESADSKSISGTNCIFDYVDHIRSYPTFRFGGGEGTRVCTVAFIRKANN